MGYWEEKENPVVNKSKAALISWQTEFILQLFSCFPNYTTAGQKCKQNLPQDFL